MLLSEISAGPTAFHLPALSGAADISGLYVGSLDVKPEEQDLTRVVATRSNGEYVPSGADPAVGDLLYSREGTLNTQRFDAAVVKSSETPFLSRNRSPRRMLQHGSHIFPYRKPVSWPTAHGRSSSARQSGSTGAAANWGPGRCGARAA